MVTEVYSKEFRYSKGEVYPAQKFIEDSEDRVKFSGKWFYYNYEGTGSIDNNNSSITVNQRGVDLGRFRIEIICSYHPSFPEVDRNHIRGKIKSLGLTRELESDKTVTI